MSEQAQTCEEVALGGRRSQKPAAPPDLNDEIWTPDHVRAHCSLPSNKAAFEWMRRAGARETPDRRSLRITKRKFLAWLDAK